MKTVRVEFDFTERIVSANTHLTDKLEDGDILYDTVTGNGRKIIMIAEDENGNLKIYTEPATVIKL